MNAEDPNCCLRMAIRDERYPHVTLLLVLLLVLVSVAGCQPGASLATEVAPIPIKTLSTPYPSNVSAPSSIESVSEQPLRFGHLTTEDGLSNSTAWDLMVDRQGYLWIATFDGLNRDDGYDMTVFKHHPEDPTSIGSSFTKCVVQDTSGAIWVGTSNGVSKYDPKTETFEAMARQLGVTYRDKAKGTAPAQQQAQALTAKMLAALPPESLHDLRVATLALDRQAAFAAIEQFADQAPDVAAGLRELVDNFQMGRLQELLAKTEETHG